MFKLSLTWHMKFFNDFHWFSMTFPDKIPFFQVNIKFNDFSSQGLNSMTFPGLCRTMIYIYMTNHDIYLHDEPWYIFTWQTMIYIYMTSPSVCLWKTVQHRQDYLSRWLIKFRSNTIQRANKIQKQYNTKTGPQTDDVWRILWRQREREAVATDFLRRPYATPEWRWFWHANKIFGITPFMLNGLYRNMPVFLEDSFLILEHEVSFGFVPYPSSVLIYKNRPQGKLAFTAQLSCQWSIA